MATRVQGNNLKHKDYSFNFFSFLNYTIDDSSPTQYKLTLNGGLSCNANGTVGWGFDKMEFLGTDQTTKTSTNWSYRTNASTPNDQETWTDFVWTWDKKTTTQTITIQCKATDASWSKSGTTTSTASVTLTIPAITSYQVTYDANGGTGTINPQIQYHDIAITLDSGSAFSRANYDLTGWATSAGTPYALGGSYKGNAVATMLAQWSLRYMKPTISNVKVYRVATNSGSNSTTESDTGGFIYVNFTYTGGKLGANLVAPKIKIIIDGSQKIDEQQNSTTGTISKWYGTYSTDTAHSVTIQLYDSNDTTGTSLSATVSAATYAIDLIGSGVNVYMGVMTHAESDVPLKLEGFTTEGDIILSLNNNAASGVDHDILQAISGWNVTV